jgi:hypothetical protein
MFDKSRQPFFADPTAVALTLASWRQRSSKGPRTRQDDQHDSHVDAGCSDQDSVLRP